MSDGPPFPRPLAGSNSIGRFIVGQGQIGNIPLLDPWESILSQYANSGGITGVITSFFAAMDVTELTDEFYDASFNIITAFGAGLDNYGRILQVSRVLQVSAATYFGFASAVPGVTTYGFGSFYSGVSLTTNVALSDTAYRVLLLAKAAANISDGSIKSINSILSGLFPGRGNAYVVDNQNMTLTYTFAFHLTALEQSIVGTSGVLPKPAGVSASVSFP